MKEAKIAGGQAALPHPREEERVRALHALKLLDGEADERFDRLSRFASRTLNIPIALISLIDVNRQWFLSRCGLDATETPRGQAICAHAILVASPFVIEDATADSRFADSPLVTGPPYIRFYAGVVLRDRNELPLGTLCVIDTVPRQLAAHELRVLEEVARLVEEELRPDGASADRRVQAQLRAGIDPLTRALGRERFLAELDRGFSAHAAVSLALVNLDNLDQLNDIFGQQAGDGLLIELTQRLCDAGGRFPAHLIGRFSGRRVVLGVCSNGRDVIGEQLASALATHLQRAFSHDDRRLAPSLSITIADRDDTVANAVTLFERCRLVKLAQGTQVGVSIVRYDPAHGIAQERRVRIAADIGAALEADNLRLVFQPKIASEDRRICGFEALLRWKHPALGAIAPPDIIEAACDTNDIVALDRWVIEKAIVQQARWNTNGFAAGPMAVNVTGQTLLSPGFVSWLQMCFGRHGVDEAELEIEVLESSLFDEFEQIVMVLQALRALGIGLSLDDFGTGYSSLSYLRNLPVTALKIDRSFVSRIDQHDTDRALCAAIVDMAGHLGLRVIAEGVETEAQSNVLRAIGCDEMQGYHFSHPLEIDAATRLLGNGDPNDRAVA